MSCNLKSASSIFQSYPLFDMPPASPPITPSGTVSITWTMAGFKISKEMEISTAVYLLRLVQLTTLSITCFGACYLIWMHNHHYCAYYSCSGTEREELGSVPIGEVIFVTCVRDLISPFFHSSRNSPFPPHLRCWL